MLLALMRVTFSTSISSQWVKDVEGLMLNNANSIGSLERRLTGIETSVDNRFAQVLLP